jgi:hypothetical protein
VDAAPDDLAQLRALVSVCCLECGDIYSKPVGGSTAQKNPGCPECGYVGWIPVSLPPEPRAPSRFGEDLQPPRFSRSH